jgi:DNA repair protein RadC
MSDATPPPPPSPNRLRDLAAGQRPQERAFSVGVGKLADHELLALILRSGTRGHDVVTLAQRLLTEAGSLHALARWEDRDFLRLKGIGKVKSLQLCTVMEIARRVLTAERDTPPVLSEPHDLYAYLHPLAFGLDVEKFWVLTLNSRNRLLRCTELTSGTSIQTLVRPAEVLREVIREGAQAFVAAHNHPTGDPFPSSSDARVTQSLRAAADAVGLHFTDHLILGDPQADPTKVGYYSFRAAGRM